MEETIDRIPKLKKNITELRPEIVDKMERRANLSILDTFASSNIYSGTITSAKSINVVRFIDQSKGNDSFRDGNVFCNQVEVFKSTIQNGLRSICECLKINPDAHISEQEVVCVIISGIKALQLKYSLELKTNTQLKNDNETLIIAVNNQKLMRNILPMKIKKLKDKTMIYIKLSQCWIGNLVIMKLKVQQKRKNYKVEFLL